MTASNAQGAAAQRSPPQAQWPAQRGPGQDTHRPAAHAGLQAAFERALARTPATSCDDNAAPQPPPQPVMAAGAPLALDIKRLQELDHERDCGDLVFISSQPVAAALPGQGAWAGAAAEAGAALNTPAAPGADARPTPAALGAALSALRMPASPEGVQHWQFSFSQPGSALRGVVLTAQPHAPWQLQVLVDGHGPGHVPLTALAQSVAQSVAQSAAQSAAQSRERIALDARVAELRQRLAGRGALVGDIELRDLQDSLERR